MSDINDETKNDDLSGAIAAIDITVQTLESLKASLERYMKNMPVNMSQSDLESVIRRVISEGRDIIKESAPTIAADSSSANGSTSDTGETLESQGVDTLRYRVLFGLLRERSGSASPRAMYQNSEILNINYCRRSFDNKLKKLEAEGVIRNPRFGVYEFTNEARRQQAEREVAEIQKRYPNIQRKMS